MAIAIETALLRNNTAKGNKQTKKPTNQPTKTKEGNVVKSGSNFFLFFGFFFFKGGRNNS